MAKKALLIGVSDYQNDWSYKRLRVPPVDVRAMKRVLENQEIGGFDQVIELLNPTSQEMGVEVEMFFKQSKRDDTLLLYFSGHCDLDKHQNNKLYFITKDSKKDQDGQIITALAVSAEDINRFMSCKGIANEQILIIDGCYSGAIRSAIKSRGVSEDINLNEEEIKEKRQEIKDNWANLRKRGSAILTSSSLSQESYERDYFNKETPIEPSLFTGCIVESLESGEADINKNGHITISELFRHIKPKVEQISLNYGERYKMTPQIESLREGYDIVIAKVPKIKNLNNVPVGKNSENGKHLGGDKIPSFYEHTKLFPNDKLLQELEKHLIAENWREADLETMRIMLEIADRENREPKQRQEFGWLRKKDIEENLPPEEISQINQLWVKHSKGHFGFSIQAQIWLECKGKSGKFDFGSFQRFGDRVGWCRNQKNWLKKYDQFNLTLDAPQGHLPSLCFPPVKNKQDISWSTWKKSFEYFLPHLFKCS